MTNNQPQIIFQLYHNIFPDQRLEKWVEKLKYKTINVCLKYFDFRYLTHTKHSNEVIIVYTPDCQ